VGHREPGRDGAPHDADHLGQPLVQLPGADRGGELRLGPDPETREVGAVRGLTPDDLRRLSPSKLPELAQELREFLIHSVSTRGGHFAAGLGTVFIWHAIEVYRNRHGAIADRAAKKLFGFSILYLFLIFALIIAERAIGVAPFGPVLG